MLEGLIVVENEIEGLIKVVAYFTVILKNIQFDTRTQDLPILNRSAKY